jgi:hypothetical protein
LVPDALEVEFAFCCTRDGVVFAGRGDVPEVDVSVAFGVGRLESGNVEDKFDFTTVGEGDHGAGYAGNSPAVGLLELVYFG